MAAGPEMTPPNTASKPTPLAKISGMKIKTTAIQPVVSPTVAEPANRPMRRLSQCLRDLPPPNTAIPTGTRNSNPSTSNGRKYNMLESWPSHPRAKNRHGWSPLCRVGASAALSRSTWGSLSSGRTRSDPDAALQSVGSSESSYSSSINHLQPLSAAVGSPDYGDRTGSAPFFYGRLPLRLD